MYVLTLSCVWGLMRSLHLCTQNGMYLDLNTDPVCSTYEKGEGGERGGGREIRNTTKAIVHGSTQIISKTKQAMQLIFAV